MAFSLEVYPISYIARYNPVTKTWEERWHESDTLSYAELQKLSETEKNAVMTKRNNLSLPTISYTSQYGYGCFEGMKAFPQKNGGIALFRPNKNAERFENSMRGLKTPVFPEKLFVAACVEVIKKNAALGYVPEYDESWEKETYAHAQATYLRPFMNSEGAIGVNCAAAPYVVISGTTVGSYFKNMNTKAVTTKRIRATPHGTGSIKCASNYVISALAKREAEEAGFMEVIYLDSEEKKFIEEGSSCNIFFLLKNGTLVTPFLGDTILPGITRASVIELARQESLTVEERKISIDEAMNESKECFVTGTAAGITPIESITHNEVEAVFNNRQVGEISSRLQYLLKGGQYGLLADTHHWNLSVTN